MKKLIIIGGGNMGYAIASGIASHGLRSKSNIIFIEQSKKQINKLKEKGYTATSELRKTFKKNFTTVEVVILAVKPNDFATVLNSLNDSLPKAVLVISIAAGIKIKSMAKKLHKSQPLARVMPNTPCQIREGISVIAYNKSVSKKQKDLTRKIFNSLGKTLELNESHFDAVTAVSGSGPAYFCYFIECLLKGSAKLGLKEETASQLIMQTAYGTLKLLQKNNLSPTVLREKVTSKKGTTEAALKVLQKKHLDKTIFLAIKAAKKRGEELGK